MQLKEAGSEEIQEILKENDVTKIHQLLETIRQQRQYDVLLSTILRICNEEEEFKISSDVLNAISEEYLPKLGALSAFDQAVKLIGLIRENKSRSTTSSLLQKLVFSAQLLSASKLRSLVKSDLVQLHSDIFAEDRSTAAVLSTSIFYTLVMEISYSASLSHSEVDELKKVWERVLCVEESGKSAILQLSSFMFYTSLGEDASYFVKNISRQKLLREMMVDCGASSVVEKQAIIAEYDYVVLQFILTNISMLASTFSKKKLPHLIEFLVWTSTKYQLLDDLADKLAGLPNLRYGGRMELFEQLFFAALEDHPAVEERLFLGSGTLFASRRRKFNEVESTSQPPKIPKLELKDKQHETFTWQDFIDSAEKNEELKRMLHKTSSAQLLAMIEELLSENAGVPLQDLAINHCREILVLLRFFMTYRKGFQIEFHEKIVELMMTEQDLKTNSLQLAARLLVSNRGERMPMFISLCIGFFAPAAAKYFQDQVSFMENFAFDHAYVLAKLEFLLAVFKYFPKIAQTQAYLIGTLLPDFFLQLSTCKKEGLHFESEQLEHKLSILCKAVKGQKEAYHKFVPFFLSCSLTGEREINFPTYVLLSICDDHDLAVLSTNLPPQEKKKYANIQAQFYSMNKIIG